MLTRLVAAAVAALTIGACGGASPAATPSAPAPLSAASAQSDRSELATPKDFAQPIAAYRGHVRRALTSMLADLHDLRAASVAGDLGGARAAWLRADARYETIGAAYGAFGDLDHAINATPGNTGRLVGLHLVERALWRDRDAHAAAGPTAALQRAVSRLRARSGQVEIDPLDYALRAHEVLEDTLHLQLSGQASPWSSSALNALTANVDGTRFVLRTVGPMVARRDPSVLPRARQALTRLEAAVRPVRSQRWDALPLRRRELIAGVTAQAAERLAFVPEAISPLPPLPPKPAVQG